MKVGVAKETAPGERRVALVPEALGKLQAAGLEILVEHGAGAGSAIPDSAYTDAGATVVPTDALYAQADVVLRVAKPSERRGRDAAQGPGRPRACSSRSSTRSWRRRSPTAGVTAISLDAIPRTLSRAQTMDALSSQANVGGYKAVLIAAERLRPLLPAADDRRRHRQAGQRPDPGHRRGRAPGDRHGQAARRRRQGVRRPARDARAGREPRRPVREAQDDHRCDRRRRLCPRADAEERAAQQAELNEVIGGMDVVITTAQVPGRKPPVLVTADAVGKMKPGSVIVDMAASRPRRQLRAVTGRPDGRPRRTA